MRKAVCWVTCCWLMFGVCAEAHADWILFCKVDLGYHDRRGNRVALAGRTNRHPANAFYHAGTLSPDLSRLKVLERYETGKELLVRVDLVGIELSNWMADQGHKTLSAERYGHSGKQVLSLGRVYASWADFKPRTLSENEAMALLVKWGFVFLGAESGVTK